MKKKILIIIFTFCFCCLPLENIKVQAFEKTKISSVTATSNNYNTIAKYGISTNNKPSVTVNTGSPAFFLIDKSNGDWQKKVDDNWIYQDDTNFTEGVWRFHCQVRIEYDDALNYVLTNPLSVFLNNEQLGTEETFVADNYSYTFVNFPEITIEKPEYIKGDVNNDGTLTLLDVRLSLQKMLNNDYNDQEKLLIDYNEDGNITLLDIRLILQAFLN